MADLLDTQVVVVGAGPVGLMLAAELRLGGADVVVLERRHAASRESRASTLHARTMEILDIRGQIEEFGSPPNEPRGHFGGIPLDLTLPGPYPGQWKVLQTRTEALLEEWALFLGVDIRCGHELLALSGGGEDDSYVEAQAVRRDGTAVRVRARYLVGCDGEDSTVRRLVGAAFPGHDAGRELIRADVSGIDIPNRRFERLEQGLAIAARRPDGVTRVMVHEFGSTARPRTRDAEFVEVADVWKRVTGEDISGGTPLWVNAFGDASRLLESYRHGRVLFAGDAAHKQMPIGGQALNLGLQDAFNLGWKLAAEVTGRAADGLLDSYHGERHMVGRRVLANIEAQAGLLLGGPEVEPLRSVLTELMGLEPVRAHLAGMISGLDVRYDVGGDGQAERHPLLGARLPVLRLVSAEGPLTTAELLRTGRGLLLDLGGAEVPAAVRGAWADRVATAAARPAEPGGPLDGAGCVLVRPDGHVVWVGSAGQAGRGGGAGDGLRGALERWFGAPR
ncbi:FAD-dependent monooxygenase [Streptomyces sp. NPDC060028]|uniref:FAD-dependent monooxygenase n=1 Tax=Streptomyces sp. NPDC060028 TaxID=3347041 RepID=UPI0036C49FE0